MVHYRVCCRHLEPLAVTDDIRHTDAAVGATKTAAVPAADAANTPTATNGTPLLDYSTGRSGVAAALRTDEWCSPVFSDKTPVC